MPARDQARRRGVRKILYVCDRTGFSGAEVVLIRLVRNVPAVEPVVMAAESLTAQRLREAGVKVYTSRFFRQTNRKDGNSLWLLHLLANMVLGAFEFAKIVARERPQIVHANCLGAAIYASVPSKLLLRPFVWTDQDVFEPGTLEARWTRRISTFTDRIVAVSRCVERNLVEIGVSPGKVATVHSGLDVRCFDPARASPGSLRARLRLGSTTTLIALFAGVTPWKGHHVVVEAAHRLVRMGRRDFAVVFVGATHAEWYRQELTGQIEELGLGDVVRFAGFESDVRAAYADTDILLNASVKPEPFGTTIYEAMAMEKVVIASRIGGNPEIVQHRETGYLVPPSDPDALAVMIDCAIDNLQHLKPMRKRARHRVATHFGVEQMVDGYSALYDELLGRPPAGQGSSFSLGKYVR